MKDSVKIDDGMEKFTWSEGIKKLATEFWTARGENPTHLILSNKQYANFNQSFQPISKRTEPSLPVSYTMENGVELIIIKCEVLKGTDQFLPQVVRIVE